MGVRPNNSNMVVSRRIFSLVGWLALALALVSIVDLLRPRPFDGVVLDERLAAILLVREVLPGSGAYEAGIRPGDTIVGIDRSILKSTSHAAQILGQRAVGDVVPYLVEDAAGVREVEVELGPRRLITAPYFYACLLGFAFFFVGWFVFRKQPRQRAAQLFFLLGGLFMLFLVFRLRPLSYSAFDAAVLRVGTLALLWLPACFLHFFLVFPRRIFPASEIRESDIPGYDKRLRHRWIALLVTIYLIPFLTMAAVLTWAQTEGRAVELVSGAPLANWWVLAIYMVLGLGALLWNIARLRSAREKRGGYLVLFGSLFGLLPFLITAVAFPAILHTDKFLYLGVFPLTLVPLTFAYAIVVFRMLDVQVILRKSVLYTVTTVAITAIYALVIAGFGVLSTATDLAGSVWFPVLLALAIVLLFEPLRRRVQGFVNRFIYAERSHLERALQEIEVAFSQQDDLREVVRGLVETLPERLELKFAGLYLAEADLTSPEVMVLNRVAGPDFLPEVLPSIPGIEHSLAAKRGVVALGELESLVNRHRDLSTWVEGLTSSGVKVVCVLSSPRRTAGLMVLSDKTSQMVFEEDELGLLRRLSSQAALALETNTLLLERTAQAEIEKELAIAASVQEDLLPETINFGPGWEVEAHCTPAKKIGGDFFTELPGPTEGSSALVYGDVAGKSISGALMMMAAHEALHSLALTERSPQRLFWLANQRLYVLGKRRSFVALAYLTSPDGTNLDYVLAGQPEPLIRGAGGEVSELTPPAHRIPLGGLLNGDEYQVQRATIEVGDLLLCYSDGVTEAMNPEGELFGLERLKSVVESTDGSPRELVAKLVEEIAVFVRDAEQYDDITVIALRRPREMVAKGSAL